MSLMMSLSIPSTISAASSRSTRKPDTTALLLLRESINSSALARVPYCGHASPRRSALGASRLRLRSDTTRRMANQAFFTRIYLDADDTIRTEPTPSFGLLLDPDTQQQALSWAGPQRQAGKRPTQTLIHDVEGSSKTRGVELGGLEPPTSWVRSKRSPN
jgi:hypothetical protein